MTCMMEISLMTTQIFQEFESNTKRQIQKLHLRYILQLAKEAQLRKQLQQQLRQQLQGSLLFLIINKLNPQRLKPLINIRRL